MIHSRFSRRIVPVALVVGFAIFVPVRAHAFGGGFESAWEHLRDLFGGKVLKGLFEKNSIAIDPNGKPGSNCAGAGEAKGLFGNQGITLDPNGGPAPSGVTGGGGAGLLQGNGMD